MQHYTSAPEICAFYFPYFPMVAVARDISRRKHNKPAINASIAQMNSIAIAPDGSMLTSDPIKSAAITMQIKSADSVHRLIAQWIHRARLDSVVISFSCAVDLSFFKLRQYRKIVK